MHRDKVHMGLELTEAKDTLKCSIWGQLTHGSRAFRGKVHMEALHAQK